MTRPQLLRRTHHAADWTLEELLVHKERTGIRVSLVLPARDEAATVGAIVTRVREELVEAVPLVDEIVVIDSDSTDETARAARDAGAVVHEAAAIRPELGGRPGKGEAMWKSLFVTIGDVLVFMDADLTEWGPHFVTGLLGPLLAEDGVDLVKGFYDRPKGSTVKGVHSEVPSEGGRVTELVARPLIALHWPELGGVVQPLAGEWAVRRDLFEQLSVPYGYAVELAALVDTARLRGADAIAQVDLGLRKHGHQPLRDLGAMSLQILAMAEARVSGTPVADEVWLQQYDWSTGEAVPGARAVDLGERPPAGTVPGYAAEPVRRGAASC
ncbi:MAG TPA: glucosyl-3-phosphoglycerate synthase [Nocardioidaceae bacterium]|nr:glucosyl-3-phosphoglycerate synthase [Nocardioidaceae bacterium]